MFRLGSLALLAGCYSGFESEQTQLHFDPTETVVVEPYVGLVPNDSLLLEGTEVCAAITCSDSDATCPHDIDIATCFDQSADNGSPSAEGCAAAGGAGTFVWHFDPVADVAACGADPATYTPEPDAVTFEVVATTDVTPHLYQWAERGAEQSLFPPDGVFPNDWTVADDEPFQIVDGGALRLPIVFERNSDGHTVAWDTSQLQVQVVTMSGPEPGVTVPAPGWLEITGATGGTSAIQVTDGADTWIAGTVVGVSPDVASLDLVVAFDASDGQPFAARAVIRDAAGALVYGAPVVWNVTVGDLVVDSDGDLPGSDYAMLRDACSPPPTDSPEPRTATLEASFGGATDQTTFTWTAPVADPGAAFVPDPACDEVTPSSDGASGCACDHSDTPTWGAAILLAWITRFRRASGRPRGHAERQADGVA